MISNLNSRRFRRFPQKIDTLTLSESRLRDKPTDGVCLCEPLFEKLIISVACEFPSLV